MSRKPKFGVTLPQLKRTWEEASNAAVEFDRLGYDSVWVCDHVFGVPAPQIPILEAWTELAAVAAITEHVKLGTLVTPPFLRNPAILAKQIATLDHISNGRVIAGLGAGWFQAEFEGTGSPFPSLGARLRALEETVQIMKALWTEERASFSGEHFQIRDAVCEPKPAQPPAILIGGSGEKVLMGIAARHADIWNNPARTQAELAGKIEVLRRRCDEEGRDFDAIEISQQCTVVLAASENEARAALDKAAKIYGGHMGAALEKHGIWGSPERVIDCIEQHLSLGCTMFPIEFFGRDTRAPARLFADKVLPAFQ